MTRTPPHPPDETADELRASLLRNNPELTDEQLDAMLTGEPARTRRPVPRYDNWGKRESGYEQPSSGRTTGPRGGTREHG